MVIGLVFAGIAGTLILLATRSGDPVEYHKREYRRALRGIAGQMSLLDRWRFQLHLPRSNPQQEYQRHKKALFECGYLEQREFYLSNSPTAPTRRLVQLATNELPRGDDLWSIQTHSNKVLVIQAERHAMKKWDEMVRRVDVAPTE